MYFLKGRTEIWRTEQSVLRRLSVLVQPFFFGWEIVRRESIASSLFWSGR